MFRVARKVADLNVSTMCSRSFDTVSSIMLCRRHPLSHTLEVDLYCVDSATHDRRRLGASDVVEVSWLDNERRGPIDVAASVHVRFLCRPRRASVSQILACSNTTAIHRTIHATA